MRLWYRVITTIAALAVAMGFAATTAHAATGHTSGTSITSKSPGGWSGGKDSHWDKGGGERHNDSHRDEFRHDEFRHDHHDNCCDNHRDHCCDNGGDSSNDCEWWREHDHDRWWRDCEGH